MRLCGKHRPPALLCLAAFIILPLVSSRSLPAQTAPIKPDSPSHATQATPGWKMSDDDFKTFLLQIETILPIYESSLSDLEAYVGKQQNLAYRPAKMILDDVQTGRKDVNDLREMISTLRTPPRSAVGEILLEKLLYDIGRDELDIERDEIDVTFAEYQLDLKFPSPSGLRGCRKQFLDYEERAEKDYTTRIFFLETQLSRSEATH